MPELKKKRDVGIDVAKGFAMFLVVFIHVRRYAPTDAPMGLGALWADNFCSIASMSVFFMISGWFSRKLFEQGDGRKLLLRMVGYLWPVFVIFVCVAPLTEWCLYGCMPSADMTFVRGIMSAGWFFFCLMLSDGVTFAAYRIARGRRMVLASLLAVSYLVFWALPVGLFHACEMLPFFWFGLFCLPAVNRARFRAALGFLMLAAYAVACVACGDFEKSGLVFHFSEMHLLSFSWKGLGLMAARIGLGIAGALGFLELVRSCVRHFPSWGRLAALGSETLGIFFVHTQILPVYFGCRWLGWYDDGLVGRTALSVAILLVSFALVKLINANRWIRALVWNPFVLFMPVRPDKVG